MSKMIKENEFDSEFSNVKYMVEDNIVLLKWKKFCCYNDYRSPTTFALELLKKYPNSNFIVDARNGFDDDFAKENYMEERTGDNEHLEKVINNLNISTQSKILDLGTGSGYLAFPIAKNIMIVKL